MPWKEQRKMSQKLEFVEKARKPGVRMTTLCREYGISRETGYKWLNRYKREGADGLEEHSRRPKASPLSTAEDIVMAVLELRSKYPRRGPKKLCVQLKRVLGEQTPSVATIARILKRFGQVRQRSRFRRINVVDAAPSIKAQHCNEIWTVDFKGWWRLCTGQRCEPLTVRDAYSRYVFAVQVLTSTNMLGVKRAFERIFRRYGVPQYIQCDNGNPFVNVQARGGLTRLSAWWVSLGIKIVRSRPGCPQDNGGHERMHRDIREDLQGFPATSLASEQRDCDRWRQEFNHVRPHEALGGKTPAEVYVRSERRPKVVPYMYPPTWLVRTVTDQGVVNVNYAKLKPGKSLVRERVALQPLGGSVYRLWFRDLDLGSLELPIQNATIDEATQKYVERRTKKAA